ncbi:DUF4157 domain-containing protein [Kitasatospora sp. NPDC008050]|uniref:eCIS core domain-containing protein n=1 Tax=Kitasatospora sp. NPDC008050 TaxID=3364021 RepID=UPI0036DFD381
MRAQRQTDRTETAQSTTVRAQHPAAAGQLLGLQRTVGNAVVARRIARSRDEQVGEQTGVPVPDGHGRPVQRASGVHEVLRSPGRPLDERLRGEMESRFGGADFSDVRVHSGPAAQRSASEIGARAYTSGSHVVIGAGGGDKHTLAHELTHVVQQRSGQVAGTDNGSGLRVSDPMDAFERAAEANAHRVMSAAAPARLPAPRTRSTETAVARRTNDVQRYADDAASGLRVSESGRYAVTVDGPTVWIRQGEFVAPVLRQVQNLQAQQVNGAVYEPYQIGRFVLKDCLHAAEELINNRAGELASGASEHSRIEVQWGAGSRSEKFGRSEGANIAQARRFVGPSNHAASPQAGQAFVILAQHTPEDEEMSPYHAAAVVGRDGNDCVTLEVWSAPGNSTASARIYTVGNEGRSFHGFWQQQYFHGTDPLTVALNPARPQDLVPAAVPQPVNPAV